MKTNTKDLVIPTLRVVQTLNTIGTFPQTKTVLSILKRTRTMFKEDKVPFRGSKNITLFDKMYYNLVNAKGQERHLTNENGEPLISFIEDGSNSSFMKLTSAGEKFLRALDKAEMKAK